MNACKRNRSRIHLLVENELAEHEAAELRKHLDTCPHCSEVMRDFLQTKSLAEEKLAGVRLRDEAQLIQAAMSGKRIRRNRHIIRTTIKIAFVSAAAMLGFLFVGGFLFFKLYFGRTFAADLSDSVLRCSEGLKVKDKTGNIEPLAAARHLRNGTEILTPDDRSSFVSFNGIRVLSSKASEFTIEGSRKLAFGGGDIAIESAKKRQPLRVDLGAAEVETNNSSIRISGSGNLYSVACISGTASVKTGLAGKRRQLESGQTALVDKNDVKLVSSSTKDLFAFRRSTVLDRIRERFEQIIAKYSDRIPGMRLSYDPFSPRRSGWRNGLQFVSYMETAAAPNVDVARSVTDYYNSLFQPGNRSISIGRQRIVPLDPDKGASFPRWSNDGKMIAFIETSLGALTGVARVVKLDDLDDPWDVSQDYNYRVRSMFPLTWTPDDRHVLFQVETGPTWDERGPTGNFALMLAPIDPADGPLVEFNSPFYDIPLPLPLPVGKTISPGISSLPWGDAMVCANWGNLAYIPVERDGQAVQGAEGIFLTDFNQRHVFVMGGGFSPSGNMMDFTAVSELDFDHMNSYIMYDADDILDGFAPPPRSLEDPRIKRVAPTENMQFTGGFSFDESLVFVHEDVNHAFNASMPTMIAPCDFDIFYTSALPGEPGKPVQIHMPGNQMFLSPSPEGNRICYSNFVGYGNYQLRIVSFDIEADIFHDLGGVLIDNSGTSLIVPPGALQQNFAVRISTPFSIGEEAELKEGDNAFFAMRLLDAKDIDNPKFTEPMTLTIRYTDEEAAGMDEGMLEIYYYDESDPSHPAWIPMGGTVDPDHNEITVEIQHFSKYAIGPARKDKDN